MITVAEAITRKWIKAEPHHDTEVWVYATCGLPLLWYRGRMHFQCECHKELVTTKVDNK